MNQIGILEQPNSGIVKRPKAITIICILGFIGVALSVPMIFSKIAIQIGSWFPPYAVFSTIVSLICMIGLWNTKKWGLYAYSALVLINQIVLIIKGEWNVLILITQGIVILIALYHLQPSIKPTFYQIALYLKRKTWAITVAYMVGYIISIKRNKKIQKRLYTLSTISKNKKIMSPKIKIIRKKRRMVIKGYNLWNICR